jgi:hypothetical protein
MSAQFEQDFFDGKRSKDVPLICNDTVKIVRGVYASRSGSVVSIVTSEATPKFLIELGDGAGDELVSFDDLERIDDDVA